MRQLCVPFNFQVIFLGEDDKIHAWIHAQQEQQWLIIMHYMQGCLVISVVWEIFRGLDF